jgi:hypothetical protein
MCPPFRRPILARDGTVRLLARGAAGREEQQVRTPGRGGG